MPTQDIKKPLAAIESYQVVIDGNLPPVTVDAEGTIRYGRIQHVEFKGKDADGNTSANVYFHHDELSDALKADLVTVLLTHLPALAAEIGASFDLTPTPYIAPVPEPTPEPVEEPAPDPQPE